MIEIAGTVVFNETEGGFWGIQGDDGKKYCPLEMPKAFQRHGYRVTAALERASGGSFRMWGIDVAIKRIEPLAQGRPD